MIIKNKESKIKIVKSMKINEYKINSNFSGALIEIDGNHGKLKSLSEDRIYFIIKGQGEFIINNQIEKVEINDLIFIPKETPYNIIGKMKYLLICSPEFNSANDISLN